MKIAAIVPHWNRSDLLRALLQNLAAQTRPFDEIIVVDNGSTDDSAEVAASVRLIRLGRNVGFAAAVNRGIDATDATWVAILNNDVLLDADWLAKLEAEFDRGWFVTGKILSASDPSKIDATYDEISQGACSYRCGAAKLDGEYWNQASEIRMAPMTAAVFHRNLFEDIGFLDETFESYLEDADFGLRCALAGKSGWYVPAAVCRHIGSATSGAWHENTVRLIARNQMVLAAKYFDGQPGWPLVAGQLLWGLVALRHGRGLAWLRGKREGFALRGRQREHSARRHSSSQRERLASILNDSERHILDVQRKTGFDWYWRVYFWLRGR